MKIYIGNLCDEVTDNDIKTLFGQYGGVVHSIVSKDDEGNHLGHGYVQMQDCHTGEAAIKALNKKRFKQHFLSVTEAIDSNCKCCEVA
jgi:RNA recognition motif-containing protein